jgi:S1-C subfamily serine protease
VILLHHLQEQQKQYFNNSGVVVTNVHGVVFLTNGIPIGTIIAYINGKPINSSKDIDQAFLSAQERNMQICNCLMDDI